MLNTENSGEIVFIVLWFPFINQFLSNLVDIFLITYKS